MSQNIEAQRPTYDERACRKAVTIWDRWHQACDICGRLESSLKERLFYCSRCLVSKYCSTECQKRDWSGRHKNQCHLFEVDRKLSEVFVKSLGPESINDPTLNLDQKVVQWSNVNARSADLIACAVLNGDKELAKTNHVGIYLKLVGERGKGRYDERTFIIDKVALIPREETETWSNVMMGFCQLPGSKTMYTRKWMLFDDLNTTLPPGFDVHRFITHVNRGITHFHGSFWPLARRLPDSEFKAAEPPAEWYEYMRRYPVGFSGVEGQDVLGVEKRDGERVPLYAYTYRYPEPGDTDTWEFKKLLDDPSRRRVRMVPGFA